MYTHWIETGQKPLNKNIQLALPCIEIDISCQNVVPDAQKEIGGKQNTRYLEGISSNLSIDLIQKNCYDVFPL